MKVKVYSSDGAAVKEKEIDNLPVFEGDKGIEALKDSIVSFQANMRQGNACAKMRGEVSGTGKKPWRQKGTGNARHGSRRSPIWVGGGVAHGPRPRDYNQKINKKVRRLGFSRALFDCVNEGVLSLIESFKAEEPKTKVFNEMLSKVNSEGTILIVDEFFEDNVLLAARNIARVFILDAHSLNAWDLVRHKTVLMTENGFKRVLERVNFKSE